MINIQENILLAPLTSFRIGGNAKYYVEVFSVEELKEALVFAKDKKIDFYILGGGTNLLVSDNGFAGLIIKIKMNEISANDDMIDVQAGVPLIKLINTASQQGLSGLEKLAGIPGTVGGAVRGNAGAFSSEIKSCVKNVTAFDTEKMELKTFENEQCNFAYRTSIFKENKNLIVISTTLILQKGEISEIQKLVTDTIMTRSARGLNGVKSAGSYFMNPVVENEKLCQEFEKEKGVPVRNKTLPAGWVIEQAGLLGKQIGGAEVSEKHANYIINAGEATASDVIMLVSFVKQQVRDQFGIQLTEEVNYLGF
ncbi:MAG TPA: UDP-N-acetylenolpyruvoylglucosamine reductase [Candidatus Moranbacteria bacterium]|nr:UDP-N-acetylenolpyruvoylglucosamine reductase [Candidatus Moranbacteria bacterium]HBT45698.1 UDP-N-acetylenolpyruvoylglucosamine reductase [Candidatus Moranbacteria bacterium]